jgi:hypothetical protein
MLRRLRNYYREPGNSFALDLVLALVSLGAAVQLLRLVLGLMP